MKSNVVLNDGRKQNEGAITSFHYGYALLLSVVV